LADGQTVNEKQVQNMGDFLQKWAKGIHVVAVVFNGQCPRFSQGAQDILRFAYNIFGTDQTVHNICIVFTKCFEKIPNFPNRTKVQTEYREKCKDFLKEISGNSPVPEIPVFFFDTQDKESKETISNLSLFHEWAVSNQPIDAAQFRTISLTERTEDEYDNDVFVKYEFSGDSRIGVYEDISRRKIIPFNGDRLRYSDWTIVREYKKDAGTKSKTIEQRIKTFERKDVIQHHGHSWSGPSRHNHTHFNIVRQVVTEERTVMVDYDGNKTETEWYRVQSNDYFIYNGFEGGHTPGNCQLISVQNK
jgi:hypothetical protein